jgi:Spy/CpxP family protein refolding chaperone
MKKLVVALVLAGGVAAVAFAALTSPNSTKKINTGKQIEKKERKKECRHTCPFST